MAPADWKRLTELAAVKAGPTAHEHTAAPRGSHRALFGYASPQPVGGLVTPWAAWDGAVGDRLAGLSGAEEAVTLIEGLSQPAQGRGEVTDDGVDGSGIRRSRRADGHVVDLLGPVVRRFFYRVLTPLIQP